MNETRHSSVTAIIWRDERLIEPFWRLHDMANDWGNYGGILGVQHSQRLV